MKSRRITRAACTLLAGLVLTVGSAVVSSSQARIDVTLYCDGVGGKAGTDDAILVVFADSNDNWQTNGGRFKTTTSTCKKGADITVRKPIDPPPLAETRIYVYISGDDAFYIDYFKFGPRHWGAKGGHGWCLSTSPYDASDWSSKINTFDGGKRCSSCWQFRLNDTSGAYHSCPDVSTWSAHMIDDAKKAFGID